MTIEETAAKLAKLYRQWREEIYPLSLNELKAYIKKSPKRAVLHELELNHRLNGGISPIHAIADKTARTNNYKNIAVDEMINFGIFK